MRQVALRGGCWLFALLSLAGAVTVQAWAADAASVSPREFVAGFYRWYVPHALENNASAAWVLALEHKASAFSPELARLLSAESAAQARCAELVGIDFDPFLDTQDPAKAYVVGEISHQGRRYWAAIFEVENGRRSEKAVVRAEFSGSARRWYFVNFHYPDGTNLLHVLNSPRPGCSAPRVESGS